MKIIETWRNLPPIHKIYTFIFFWFTVANLLLAIDEWIWTIMSLGGKG